MENPQSQFEYGFKTLLLGATGSGKTFSLKTLADAGLEVFILFTENGMSTLRDTDPNKVHWHYIRPVMWDLASATDMARKINTLSFQQLTSLSDPNKMKYNQMLDIFATLGNFKCDRTGKDFGPVDAWGTDKVLVIDSTSGLNLMSFQLVNGGKSTSSPGEYQIAMDRIEKFYNMLCLALKTNVVLTGHLEREVDEVSGAQRIMISTLGKKLAPKLGRFFDDVVVTYREEKNFFWSTIYTNAETKARLLPLDNRLAPSFKPIVEASRKSVQSPSAA